MADGCCGGIAELLAPVSVRDFEEIYWEQQPLLIAREQLPAALDGILRPEDIPSLARLMGTLDIEPQIIRDGRSCKLHDILRDYLDGSSTIINQVDQLWPPIGRLCSALRQDFLHVFAVLYLTPRGTCAVPAHTDDQDIFILQLAGRKEWAVFGSPIVLPYTNEQLGKHEPISSELWQRPELREPVLSLELGPGSLLYLPRGAVHEARATSSGGSMHVTLTVQSSDLSWRSLVKDGLFELHRGMESARRALPLDTALGGLGEDVGADSDRRDGVESDAPEAQSLAPNLQGLEVPPSATANSHGAFNDLMAYTASRADEAFDAAMRVLQRKVERLNAVQDHAIKAAATRAATLLAYRSTVLPDRLLAVPWIEVACEFDGIVCYDRKRDAGMRLRFGNVAPAVLEYVVERAHAQPFTPYELPQADTFEQVAMCETLRALGVLCDAEEVDVHPRPPAAVRTPCPDPIRVLARESTSPGSAPS